MKRLTRTRLVATLGGLALLALASALLGLMTGPSELAAGDTLYEYMRFVGQDLLDYLREARAQLDVVFIDPPFGRGLIQPSCEQLAISGLLAPGGLVYIEFPAKEALTNLPGNWSLHREKQAGGVAYRLFRTPAG